MYSCNKNICMNNEEEKDESALETACQGVNSASYDYEDSDNSCSCGFNENNMIFPNNPLLAQSYVPIQYMDRTFTPCCGLKNGTIFPELVTTYYPGQSMMDLEYLRSRNTIGEGCNQ